MKPQDKLKHIINQNADIMQALRMLNDLSGAEMTLAVVDEQGVMKGTLTDGDLRRGLLRGIATDRPVSEVMHCQFHALTTSPLDIQRLREIRSRGISLIPWLDENGKIIDFIDTTTSLSQLPVSAVLMAGGKGERLRPLTLTTPKPLLKIRDKAIIDYNIDLLSIYGITDIAVTVNYMAESMEEHFKDSHVKVIREPAALGTIGSVSLLPLKPEGTTLVMNADLLTTISLEDMYLRHLEQKAHITVAVIPYNLSVPYAILSTDGTNVTAIEEKPSYSYYANAGIYLFSNEILGSIPPATRIDATDLIEQAITEGQKVTFYPITGTWIDIGSPSDFKHASQLMEHVEKLNHGPS